MAYFIAELDRKAQLDIRNRLNNLKRNYDEAIDVDSAMEDKINIIVPIIEEQEQDLFESGLRWLDDDELFDYLLQVFYDAQLERRKLFGYDF